MTNSNDNGDFSYHEMGGFQSGRHEQDNYGNNEYFNFGHLSVPSTYCDDQHRATGPSSGCTNDSIDLQDPCTNSHSPIPLSIPPGSGRESLVQLNVMQLASRCSQKVRNISPCRIGFKSADGLPAHPLYGKVQKHMRGRRPSSKSSFPCHICGRFYSRKDNLRAHQRVHTGEMPYKCADCKKLFRWQSALQAHRDSPNCQASVMEKIMPNFPSTLSILSLHALPTLFGTAAVSERAQHISRNQ